MNGLLNVMRMQSELAGGARSFIRAGIVTGYNPDEYSVKVTIQPEGTETGWLPVAALAVGNEWGIFIPPSIDDQVEVDFFEGSFDVGFVRSRFFDDQSRPLSVPSGEFWIVHKAGASLKFTNDGKVSLAGSASLDLMFSAINAGPEGGAFARMVKETFMQIFNTHTHNLGAATTAVPNTLMTDADLTENLKAT